MYQWETWHSVPNFGGFFYSRRYLLLRDGAGELTVFQMLMELKQSLGFEYVSLPGNGLNGQSFG